MKYIIFGIVIIFIIVLIIIYFLKRRWAIQKVSYDTDEEKLSYINKTLAPFGFAFDLNQDIVISKNESWQRDMGYSDFYDLKAPYLNMVIDSEPITFKYNNKDYRIEFWKGQYGITTGGEIGVYIRDSRSKNHFRSADDNERLKMSFQLFKKCFLFSRKNLSWWLTGFDVGNFSNPQDLVLKSCICFPNKEMQIAFVEGLLNAGYTKNKINICGPCVCFNFCKPLNYKLNHRKKLKKWLIQLKNRINCSLYMFYTRFFNRTIDKLSYLYYMSPFLFKIVIRKCIPRKKHRRKFRHKKR